jgi:glycosyltransferase involved in cell wall biosynthesis
MSSPRKAAAPRIAFVSQANPSDIKAWSGSIYHMRRGLEAAGCLVRAVGPLEVPQRAYLRAKRLLLLTLARRNHLFDREPFVLRSWATQVERALAGIEHDIVLSPSTLPLARLRTGKPTVFWTDACFAGMLDYFEPMSRLSSSNIRNGHAAEQATLDRCSLAVYASDWAAEGAKAAYTVDPAKVRVIPFGANLSTERSREEILSLVAARRRLPLRLLFIGVDWKRKGGDLAVDIAARLNAGGLPCELDIVGCAAPGAQPSFVHQHGFLSKNRPEEAARLDALFRAASFFVLPSQAECFGVVFPEAASYGLPSLARRTGGIPNAVLEGCNGSTFPPEADAAPYAAWIRQALSSADNYERLALLAHETQRTRLSWSRSCENLAGLLGELASGGA